MKVAILYQLNPAPEVDGILKPMKEGGYSDSGADIAYSLRKQGVDVITPAAAPDILDNLSWVFPDTTEGISDAIAKGADTFWLNTVLYKNHPIEYFMDEGYWIVGQIPEKVEVYDDKIRTNLLLSSNGLPIPKSKLIKEEDLGNINIDFGLPMVIKPIRGRGSQGVKLVWSKTELYDTQKKMFDSGEYGNMAYVEEFLSGEEITISVMPAGTYQINGREVIKKDYWSLPPVKRINHNEGIAPYNGIVAVTQNSIVLQEDELNDPTVRRASRFCERAAELVEARALVRIDCRANANGEFFLFDLNMKPNMTGASRPHRGDQDSLTAIAARKIGWSFDDLLINMLNQRWRIRA